MGTQPSGTCTQIDYVHQGTESYCGVAQINCPASCQKAGAVAAPVATATPTPVPLASQCLRIKVYKGTTAVEPTTLVVGDQVTLAVGGANATKGRIRVNGAAFTETTTKNANGEFTVPFTVPTGVTTFTIEAEVFGPNGQWQ
ncbi:hypothetical protein HYV22_02315 [Candidatus Gottesmanbacteria bacterium]|nr:hypothetical protein [Candidatus Gottesmanbacteria bacterium]